MTSYEPTSAAHRERLYAAPPKPEPPPTKSAPKFEASTQPPKPQPPRRRRRPRVTVEGMQSQREQVLSKWLTTTTRLTTTERALLRELRAEKPNAARIAMLKTKATKEAKK